MTPPPPDPRQPSGRPLPDGPPAWPGPRTSPPPVDGFAVASLVVALVCLAPLGLVFGIIALVRISRRGGRGKGLAVTGIAVSGAVLLLALLVMAGALRFSAWTSSETGDPVRSASGSRTSVFALETGACFTPGTELSQDDHGPLKDATAERLPCEEPHRGEIYGSFELTGQGAFPGSEEVMDTSRERCGELLPDYVLDFTVHGRLQTYFYYPDQGGWERGGRTVLCWAGAPQGNLAESIRKDESDFEPAQYAYVTAFRPLWEAQLKAPQQGPDKDLVTAGRWAGQMAAAYEETARILREARGGLPAGAQGPAEEIALSFEEAVPHWEQAARAADADAFLTAVGQAEADGAATVELDAQIRADMGLPVPGNATDDGGGAA
nr:DUF4190 domain-containing protein [Streptomyces sp. NBC_01177]WSS73274.1 DUF4190 domain-containing protein [Streptomyces sp. NBC_01175]